MAEALAQKAEAGSQKPEGPPAGAVRAALEAARARMDADRAEDVIGYDFEGRRARWHALAALLSAFPGAAPIPIARALGFGRSQANSARSTARKYAARAAWWREGDQTAVRCALAAHLADQAAAALPAKLKGSVAVAPAELEAAR